MGSARFLKTQSEKFHRVLHIPPKSLGYVFWWAWVQLAFYTPVLHFGATPSANSGIALLGPGTIAAGILVIVCLLPFSHRLVPLSERNFFLFGSAFATSLGTLLVAFSSSLDSLGLPMLIIGICMAGVGITVQQLLWGEYYATLDREHALVATLVSFLLALGLAYFFTDRGAIVDLALVTILPLLSVLILRSPSSAIHEDGTICGFSGERNISDLKVFKPPLPGGLILVLSVYGLTFGVFQALLAPVNIYTDTALHAAHLFLLCGAIAGLAILAVSLLSSLMVEVDLIYRITLPAIAIATFVLSTFGISMQALAWAIVVAGIRCVDLIMWVIFSNISRQSNIPALNVFGWGRLVALVAVLAGGLLGDLLSVQIDFPGGLTSVALVLVVLALLGSAPLLGKRVFQPAVSAAEGKGMPSVLPVEVFLRSQLARDANLSTRELEVLEILGRGRTVTYVAQELHIAKSTAATHSRNIYLKLGVHNRQQLLDLIDRTAEMDIHLGEE